MWATSKHVLYTCAVVAGSSGIAHASWLPWSTASKPEPKSGPVYVWGRHFCKQPRRVQGVPDAVTVAVHDGVGCAVTATGEAWGFAGTNSAQRVAERVVGAAIRGDPAEVVLVDDGGRVWSAARTEDGFSVAKQLRGALRRARVVDVTCGKSHCVAISDRGDAYSWGARNTHNQLGRTDATDGALETPQKIDVPRGTRIVQAACGDQHTLLLTDKGEVYSAGDDRWTQLGKDAEPWQRENKVEHVKNELTKAELIADLPVKQVSCGAQHSVVLVRDGTLFSFGYNMYGQLGHHNYCTFAPPSPIANMAIRAARISVGANSTCALGDDGALRCVGAVGNSQQPNMKWRRMYEIKANGGKRLLRASHVAQGGDSCAIIAADERQEE